VAVQKKNLEKVTPAGLERSTEVNLSEIGLDPSIG